MSRQLLAMKTHWIQLSFPLPPFSPRSSFTLLSITFHPKSLNADWFTDLSACRIRALSCQQFPYRDRFSTSLSLATSSEQTHMDLLSYFSLSSWHVRSYRLCLPAENEQILTWRSYFINQKLISTLLYWCIAVINLFFCHMAFLYTSFSPECHD